MDFKNKIEESQGFFENILEKIPFYSGYKEKEKRREADMILREHLAGELDSQWQRLNGLKAQMLVGPAMSQLDDLGKVSRRLQTLIDKVKSAAQGYAGMFDSIKVDEEALDTLYSFDNAMLQRVGEITAAADAVQTALDGEATEVAPAIRKLAQGVEDLNTTYDKRKDAIMGLA